MNNKGTENSVQIPGVVVAPPNAMPKDASTNDSGTVNGARVANAVSAPGVAQVAPQGTIATQTVTPTVPTTVATPPPPSSENTKPKKKKNFLARFWFFIVLILLGVLGYVRYSNQQQLVIMQEKCTPVSTSGESKELDLDSTIVQDLYNKVKTTIREDLGESELNDQLKVYLAYRQIANSDIYESQCNLFDKNKMEPFTCEDSSTMAFKEETLQLELKKLFGDDTNIKGKNVQLGTSCIGGFEYIAERGEYVQGRCLSTGATLYRVEKELIGATSTESTIVLKEKVKYYGSEGLTLPERLVSGTYLYTFRLDMNYNYVLVSKELSN